MIKKKKGVSSEKLSEVIVKGMQEKKATDIVVLDLRKLKNAVADYFVVCSGRLAVINSVPLFGIVFVQAGKALVAKLSALPVSFRPELSTTGGLSIRGACQIFPSSCRYIFQRTLKDSLLFRDCSNRIRIHVHFFPGSIFSK